MKRLIILLLLLLKASSLFSVDYELFKKMTPEEQIANLLEEYQNDKYYYRQFGFQMRALYLINEEPKDVIKPIILERILLVGIEKYGHPPFTLDILINLLICGSNFLTQEERFYLIPIIQKKIDDYVSINKIIDQQVIYYTWIIDERLLVSWGDRHPSEINPYLLQKKYLDAGYKDIAIDWEEIEARYHVPRKNYETY